MNCTMEVRGNGTIEQMEKGRPKAKCRRWRLWATTSEGRRSRVFRGTYTAAQEALSAFVAELRGIVPCDETFGAYAASWRLYREKSGDFAPNTRANDLRAENAFRRSPIWARRLDAVTPETCRADLLWVKSHPQKPGLAELSGTTMSKMHAYLRSVLGQAAADGRIAASPMERVRPPKLDTPEKEALPWDELSSVLDRLDAMRPSGFVMAAYLICCLGLRRAEACALMDADVDEERVVVRFAVKERDGSVGEPKSKAGIRTLPTPPRLWAKVVEWRGARREWGVGDAPTLACNVRGGVLLPQNLYRWWLKAAPSLGCAGVGLHQLRHSNLTHMARHMGLFDLMRYAGWSSPEPARIYVHDDFGALQAGSAAAWGVPKCAKCVRPIR